LEPAALLATQERERKLLRKLAAYGYVTLQDSRLLEIGCGTGNWLGDFVRWGVRPENICGIDLLPERVAVAREFSPRGITLACGNAARLELKSGSCDLVLQSTVFTSILDQELKRQMAREMLRVVAPSGLIIWYDFFLNNPRNPDVRGVGKAEICRLFPACEIDLEKLTLAPPIARFLAPRSRPLYHVLSSCKLCCSHYLGIIRKGLA
jgi:ubiquinone/menaquinone biosynthesis C-methylase UbiE